MPSPACTVPPTVKMWESGMAESLPEILRVQLAARQDVLAHAHSQPCPVQAIVQRVIIASLLGDHGQHGSGKLRALAEACHMAAQVIPEGTVLIRRMCQQ